MSNALKIFYSLKKMFPLKLSNSHSPHVHQQGELTISVCKSKSQQLCCKPKWTNTPLINPMYALRHHASTTPRQLVALPAPPRLLKTVDGASTCD